MATHRALKAGEILYGNYGRRADRHSVEERRAYLFHNFHFSCRCVACENDWDIINFIDTSFCCSKCSRKFSVQEKSSPSSEFQNKCVLEGPDWKCRLCGKIYSEELLKSQVESNRQVFLDADRLFSANCPREAMQRMKMPMEFFQFNLCSPNIMQTKFELLLPHVMALILHYAQ